MMVLHLFATRVLLFLLISCLYKRLEVILNSETLQFKLATELRAQPKPASLKVKRPTKTRGKNLIIVRMLYHIMKSDWFTTKQFSLGSKQQSRELVSPTSAFELTKCTRSHKFPSRVIFPLLSASSNISYLISVYCDMVGQYVLMMLLRRGQNGGSHDNNYDDNNITIIVMIMIVPFNFLFLHPIFNFP